MTETALTKAPATEELLAGTALGEFELIREIGRGGMGVVYLARQASLGRHVALKILPRKFTSDPIRLERFRREAAVISRLDHPSIVPVYAFGEERGLHFIALKFLDGDTLDRMIKGRQPSEDTDSSPGSDTLVLGNEGRGSKYQTRHSPLTRTPLSESEPGWIFRILRVIEAVARALHHAHEKGIVHRDVKPSNILLDHAGQPWLLDFGLVRDMSAEEKTGTEHFLGTAYYMAPEQVRESPEERVDHRVDVYALGVTLYESLTLTRPFAYRSPDTLFYAIVNEEPVSPRSRNSRLPKDLDTVILKAMAKSPSQRYRSALELADDLRRVRGFEPIVATPEGRVARVRKWIRRNPVVAGALLFALLCLFGMVEYGVYRHLLDERRALAALEHADIAFDDGYWQEALSHYNVYMVLGGDPDVVAPRVAQLKRRFAPRDRR